MTEQLRHCKLCGFAKPLSEYYKAYRSGPDRPPTYSCYCKYHTTQRAMENQFSRGVRKPRKYQTMTNTLGDTVTVTSFNPWNSFTVIPPLKYKVQSCSKSS